MEVLCCKQKRKAFHIGDREDSTVYGAVTQCHLFTAIFATEYNEIVRYFV